MEGAKSKTKAKAKQSKKEVRNRPRKRASVSRTKSAPKVEEAVEDEPKVKKVEERDAGNQTGNSFFNLLSAAVSAANFGEEGEEEEEEEEEEAPPTFEDYLRMAGVKMAWVRAIVALYEEPKKPDDPLMYVLGLMGLGLPKIKDIKFLQERVKELRIRMYELQSENDGMKELITHKEQELELAGLFDDRNYISDYISDDDLDLEYIPPATTPVPANGPEFTDALDLEVASETEVTFHDETENEMLEKKPSKT